MSVTYDVFFFFKQKTAYEMRISDWSSDVCSSDLAVAAMIMVTAAAAQSMVVRSTGPSAAKYPTGARLKSSDKLTLVAGDRIVLMQSGKKIGRASCRERVCQYV